MTLFIKNMVCARCIRTVDRLMLEAGLIAKNVQLGEVEVSASPNDVQLATLRQSLESEGFELLDDRNSLLVTQIKSLIINEIHRDLRLRSSKQNASRTGVSHWI